MAGMLHCHQDVQDVSQSWNLLSECLRAGNDSLLAKSVIAQVQSLELGFS